MSRGYNATPLLRSESKICCCRHFFVKISRLHIVRISALRWTESHQNRKGAWHYNHVTFTPIAKNFMLYCRLICMLSILCVRLTIKVKVGIPESFKVGWYSVKKTGSSHLNGEKREKRYFLRKDDWSQSTPDHESSEGSWTSPAFACRTEGKVSEQQRAGIKVNM